MVSLRERNRLNAMRATQRAALRLFQERGFGNVTVGEIADEVGMAPSTLYRHFMTKEDIIIWDEHEPAIGKALVKAVLKNQPIFESLRTVLVDELGSRYDNDLEFQLARVQYIYATDELHAAAIEADLENREELTEALEQIMTKRNRQAALIIAGASLLALDVAIERWQANDARTPLKVLIEESFAQLTQLDTLR